MLIFLLIVIAYKFIDAAPQLEQQKHQQLQQQQYQPQQLESPSSFSIFQPVSLISIEQLHETQNSRVVHKGNGVSAMSDRIGLNSIVGATNNAASLRSNSGLGKVTSDSKSEVEAKSDNLINEVLSKHQGVILSDISEGSIGNNSVEFINQKSAFGMDFIATDDHGPSSRECIVLDNTSAGKDVFISSGNQDVKNLNDNIKGNDQPDFEICEGAAESSAEYYEEVPRSFVDASDMHTESDGLSDFSSTTLCDKSSQTGEIGTCDSELNEAQQLEDSTTNAQETDCIEDKPCSGKRIQYPTLIERLGIAPLGGQRNDGPAETEHMLAEINRIASRPKVETILERPHSVAEQMPPKQECCSEDIKNSNSIKDQEYAENSVAERDQVHALHSELAVDDTETNDLPKKAVPKPVSRDQYCSAKHFVPIIYASSVAGFILILVACYMYYNRCRRMLKLAAFTETVSPTVEQDIEEDSVDKPFSTVVQMQSPNNSNLKTNNIFTF